MFKGFGDRVALIKSVLAENIENSDVATEKIIQTIEGLKEEKRKLKGGVAGEGEEEKPVDVDAETEFAFREVLMELLVQDGDNPEVGRLCRCLWITGQMDHGLCVYL